MYCHKTAVPFIQLRSVLSSWPDPRAQETRSLVVLPLQPAEGTRLGRMQQRNPAWILSYSILECRLGILLQGPETAGSMSLPMRHPNEIWTRYLLVPSDEIATNV